MQVDLVASVGQDAILLRLSTAQLFLTPTPSGQSQATWTSSTTDVRALQKASNPSDRIASSWFTTSSFTVDLNITDSNIHQVAVYCLDWDTTARRETVDIEDVNGNVLSSQSLTSSFNGGVYLVWNISGHVRMRVTLTGGVNAVISGRFFDVSNGSGDGGLPPGTVATIYAYDILNHLTSVSMPRGSNTQTRSFNYTSGTTVGINLLSATNPENGTVTYTYNSDNTIHTKTDAKGQVFTYAYDGYKRVTQISVGSTSLRTFMYDTNTLDGTFSGSYTKGRLVAVQNAQFNAPGTGAVTALQFTEMYGYTKAGQVSGKRLQSNQTLTGGTVKTLNMDATYAYDSEGKMTSMAYPTTYAWNGSALVPTAGPTYTYSFDAMDRATGLKDQNNNVAVSGVTYNAANQFLTVDYFTANETRTYNSMNQMTRLSIPGSLDISYNFVSGADNGKIGSQTDNISGETVTYQYDSLKRLISASGSGWSETYGYDAFGNLTSKTPTGSAPTLSQAVSATTNQIVGQTYDANGNQLSGPLASVTYDPENRILTAPGLQYAYDSKSKRIWKGTISGGAMTAQEVYFYGLNGQKLATYALTANGGSTPYLASSATTLAVFFRSKRVGITANGITTAFIQNRIGSQGNYYPFGEARGTVPQDAVGFATYTQDSATGLDYANQRYYANNFGRFTSPDPFAGSGGPTSPASWNRYAYVSGDPINVFDPSGLCGETSNQTGAPSSVECGNGNGGADGTGFTTGDFQTDSNGNRVLDDQGNPIIGDQTTTNAENVATVTDTSDSSSGSDTGWGWGVSEGLVVGAGLGPNYSFGTVANAGVGSFHCGQSKAPGGYASAGGFTTPKGGLGNYPANNTSTPNFALGAIVGRGPGMYVTNAGSPKRLSGSFTTTILALPRVGWFPGATLELDYSGGTWMFTASPGELGAGVMVLQTNTFATAGGSACGNP